ncbi:MAG TPA: radical SAM protein [Methanoregulaceae archaeon]|nr:radical SAM protein [Methanoregulaceae archaeon]HQJ87980.1 radical SAM protein [Methanoregulaceae archaeon]
MTTNSPAYGPLVRELLGRAARDRQPACGAFELTHRCNLACRFCYARSGPGLRPGPVRELSASDWVRIAREATDAGMTFLLLTGGEVLLRPDFFRIYEPLTRMGLVISVFTNGTLVTEQVAERLARAPPSRTEITLYGATSATCETVTGVPGSYHACRAGIEALLAHGIPLGLKTTLTRQNVGELEAMRRMAQDWGVPFSASWLLARRPDGARSRVEDCRLSPSEGIALEAADRATSDEWTGLAQGQTAKKIGNAFYCHAGKSAFAIGPGGEMNVCLLMDRPSARPLETGFGAAWSRVQAFVDGAGPPDPACRGCDAVMHCGRCPAWSLMETGTLTAPVPYLCEIARARKEWFSTRT